MTTLYKIANAIRRIYWFIFRPQTSGVKCLIENNDEYLLIQTSYSGKYWTLPGGGIGYNESIEQAVKREVKEELGIVLGSLQNIGHYESAAEYKKDTIHLFLTHVTTRDFKQKSSEVSKAQWFNKNDLPQNQSRALKESLLLA